MHADRRQILNWSAGSALMLGVPGQAAAQDRVSPDGHVVMLAELTVKPDKVEAFLEYTVANLKLSRSYPGNLAFDILVDEAQPHRVMFYEVWASQQAQKAYMAWRIQAGDLTTLLSFLAAEPKFTALRSIAA